MKKEILKNYLYWGITALCVIGASILVAFLFNRFEVVKAGFDKVVSILMPTIYGAVLAFLMAPVYDRVRDWTSVQIRKIIKHDEVIEKFSKAIASLVSLALLVAIITLLIWLLIPQIITSIKDVMTTLPAELESMEPKIREWFKNNPELESASLEIYNVTSDHLMGWFDTTIKPNLNNYIIQFSSKVITAVNMLFDIVIGLMVMLYLLNMKSQLAAQSKKICFGLFSIERANALIEESKYVKGVFSNFIVGKIIDSVIIGVINYFGMIAFKMPYPLLISVVVGVTNIIPFFGPFIGAIPSALILLLVSPVSCIQFLLWILVLQQVDGNIIGPRILGQTIGIPSFWVLFSILLFGGLFGIGGMIVGVPTWAVIYRVITRKTNKALQKKRLSTKGEDYLDLHHIDVDTLSYIKNKDAE